MAEDTPSASRRTLLKSGVGVAASALALSTLSSTAAAHFPEELDIDVRPGSDSNPINPRSRGVVRVAVAKTKAFDPTTEADRYRFGSPEVVQSGGGARPLFDAHVADVNGDGESELVLHFRIQEAGFEGGESEAELRWERDDSGEHGLAGRDEVKLVGPTAERGRE